MMTNKRHLLSLAIAALAPFCAPAFSQSLSLTYQLGTNEQAQRSSIANSGCAGFKWIASVGSCGQPEALGRFSRDAQREQNVARFLAPVDKPPTSTGAPSSKGDADAIPFLGESPRPVGPDSRLQGDPELSVKLDRPRVREDIERRFSDAAQEARFNRNTINALGFEVVVPFQSKLRQSADPAFPEAAPY